MKSDIKLKLSFDYSKDVSFVAPAFPNGLKVYHLADERSILQNWGFFSAWGKELEDCDTAQPGGAGFIGTWLSISKEVEWADHPEDPSVAVLESITVTAKPRNNTPNSPIILAFTLETVRYIVMLHKDNAVSIETTEELVGQSKTSSSKVQGVSIPYPAKKK